MISTAIARNLPKISGYSLTEQLYSGQRTAVYRATRVNAGDRTIENIPGGSVDTRVETRADTGAETASPTDSVIIKVLQHAHPDFNSLVQFRNQYNITKNLSIPGIIRPLGLEPWPNGYALVAEDFGGVSLNQYLKRVAPSAGAKGADDQGEQKYDNKEQTDKQVTTKNKQALSVEEGLAIAHQLAGILHELAQNQIVHKDIKE